MAPERLKHFVVAIEEILGHTVAGTDALSTALTHRSFLNENPLAGGEDNERLEFLGDAVLGVLISERLMVRYPKESEGRLSKFRSSLVNERSLATAARSMNLGTYLRLGKGEESTKGREKDSILANAFEAVVAALYMSGGLEDAARFVEHHFSELIERTPSHIDRHDYKTTLQEMTQRLLGLAPVYRMISEDGPDHEKRFESTVEIGGKVYGRGKAGSKKVSEQIAAEEAVAELRRLPSGGGEVK